MSRRLAVAFLTVGLSGCAGAHSVKLPSDPPVVSASAGAIAGDDEEVAWVCPMHADYTSDRDGKCPRCGMALVKAMPFDMRDYRLDFHTVPAVPKPAEPVTLNFRIFHPSTGEPVRKFELVHDRPYHLFVISQDMQFFEHIHPQESDDGTWSIEVTLPKPGYYEVLSDFMPSGGAAQFLARPLVTAGYSGDLMSDGAHLVPDATRSQTVDDLTAKLDFDPKPFVAGAYGHITFRFTRADSDQPVRDLQTYLGAFGHMLIMSEDMVNYVHSHPSDNVPPDANFEELRGGPDVMFEGLMPKPGRYRAWTQVRYHDKIHTFITTFEVYDVGQRVSN